MGRSKREQGGVRGKGGGGKRDLERSKREKERGNWISRKLRIKDNFNRNS